MKAKSTLGPSNSYVWYDHYIHRTHKIDGKPWILGDAHFMVPFDGEKMNVLAMDEPYHQNQDVASLTNEDELGE